MSLTQEDLQQIGAIFDRKLNPVLGELTALREDIKEIMYDKIGWSDKAFSAKLAHATFGIMDYITEQHLKNGESLVLESNYSPTLESEKFRGWQKTYDCRIIQIVCRTEVSVLAQRYFDRQHQDRHPGHNDTGTVRDYSAGFHAHREQGRSAA
jgi:hypothetical protein